MAQGDRSHEGRLSAVEQGLEGVSREIHGIRTDMRSFMQEMRGEMGSRSRTQWSPILAGVAVIIALVGAFAAGPISDISRLEERVAATDSNRFTDKDGELQQQQLNKMWDRLESVEDEDFDRPEAERMRDEIMSEVLWLRDFMLRFATKDPSSCPLKSSQPAAGGLPK